MKQPQHVLHPFYDDEDNTLCGWCPDCGLEQRQLVVNVTFRCTECKTEYIITAMQALQAVQDSVAHLDYAHDPGLDSASDETIQAIFHEDVSDE